MIEATVIMQQVIKGVLTGMTERRVTQVVDQGNRLGKVFVETEISSQGATDLGDFKSMGQAGTEMIGHPWNKDLGFVFHSSERGRMHNAITVALEIGPERVRRLRIHPTA